MKTTVPEGITEYIATHPKDVQRLMKTLRVTIRKAAPGATEAIAWGMPTFRTEGNLVHFAGFKKHIGFFPGTSAVTKFKRELGRFVTTKAGIQLPLDQPIPVSLVTRIVKFRVKENRLLEKQRLARKELKRRLRAGQARSAKR